MTISSWARRHNPSILTSQLLVQYGENSVAGAAALARPNRIVNDQLCGSTIADGAAITVAQAWHNDPMGRCLTVSVNNDANAANRTQTFRLTGHDQFGEVQTEDLAFTTMVASTAYHMFTRYAYLDVTAFVKVTATGEQVGDTVSVGVHCQIGAGFIGGTVQTGNGASATQAKGFGLPIPLSAGTTPAGLASTDFESEVRGVTLTYQTEAVTVRDWTSVAPISRAGDFLVDSPYNVMVPDEDPVVVAGTGAAATAPADGNVIGFLFHFQTNRGE